MSYVLKSHFEDNTKITPSQILGNDNSYSIQCLWNA